MSKTILAIESSCDETAVAITRDGELLANIVSTQIAVHTKYGGVMPEIASRLHAENISIVLKEALETAHVSLEEIDAFAVTRGPGLIGALHVGLQAAKTLAMLYKKPLIPVHHLAGHIYANEYIRPLKFPLLAIVVSGGNTELVIMRDHLNFEIIGETKDDAIGECYDKVARVLGLPYPGGIPIDKFAKEYIDNIFGGSDLVVDGYVIVKGSLINEIYEKVKNDFLYKDNLNKQIDRVTLLVSKYIEDNFNNIDNSLWKQYMNKSKNISAATKKDEMKKYSNAKSQLEENVKVP